MAWHALLPDSPLGSVANDAGHGGAQLASSCVTALLLHILLDDPRVMAFSRGVQLDDNDEDDRWFFYANNISWIVGLLATFDHPT